MTISCLIAVVTGSGAVIDSGETQGPFGRKKNFIPNGPWRCQERNRRLPPVAAVSAVAAGTRE
jgi:hypothetical protein